MAQEFYDATGFIRQFSSDIKRVESQLIIYSPFMTEKAVRRYLDDFSRMIKSRCQVIIVTKPADEQSPGMRDTFDRVRSLLVESGVQIIHKRGMHQKIAILDSKVAC